MLTTWIKIQSMAKRRTRKQKEKVKYTFIKKGRAEPKKGSFEPVVKGQSKKRSKTRHKKIPASKKAVESAKDNGFTEIKKDLIKSLLLASLILSIEVMVYLAW